MTINNKECFEMNRRKFLAGSCAAGVVLSAPHVAAAASGLRNVFMFYPGASTYNLLRVDSVTGEAVNLQQDIPLNVEKMIVVANHSHCPVLFYNDTFARRPSRITQERLRMNPCCFKFGRSLLWQDKRYVSVYQNLSFAREQYDIETDNRDHSQCQLLRVFSFSDALRWAGLFAKTLPDFHHIIENKARLAIET